MKRITIFFFLCTFFFASNLRGQTGGLGVKIQIHESDKLPYITEVIKGSPAEKTNLQANDFITKIDFVSTHNLTIDEVVNKLRGKVGTTCYLTIRRFNKEYPISFVRADLNLSGNSNQTYSTISYLRYTPKFGTISFDYPSTWEVGKNDNKKQAFNENYYMQPKGQVFDAMNGQVVVRIFDPVSIMEDTKSLDATFSLALFNKIVAQISEGTPTQANTTTYLGKTYYECTNYNSGFVTKILGSKSENGNLYVLAMASAPNISTENNNILYRVAQSLKGGEPNTHLTAQETIVKNWYNALSRGDKNEMENLSCSSANNVNSLISIAEQLFRSPINSSDIYKAAKLYDFSNLKFYTIAGNSELVVVRICGNIISPNGEIKSFYNYSRMMGGSNAYVVNKENGKWKICQPL